MSPADSPFAQLPAPGPHPATAELRAYAAGKLAPADEHRIEAHTLDCERCAELVEGFSMSDGATTDRAVAELRTRLQARLGQAEPEPEPEPVAGGWAWPRLAAAAALLAVVGTGIWGWQQDEPAAPPAVARHEAAPVPAANPAAPATRQAAPVAAAPLAPAPASPAPADYAAVRRQSKRRAAQQPAAQGLGGTDWLAHSASRLPAPPPHRPTANAVIVPAEPAAATESASEMPAASVAQASAAAGADNSRESKLTRADYAPAAKSESMPASPAADSVHSLSEVAVTMAAPQRKMKTRMAEPAPAMVPNTPMPAAFAIKPAPVGGTSAFRDYLRREAAQFEPEKENRISGLVHVQFTVGADGQLSNLKVTRGLRADYDEEALRLVCEGPKWQPGIAGGRRAPLVMDFTIPF